MCWYLRLAICALLVMPVTVSSQQQPITLEWLLPLERQKALGFDKLTPEERAGVARLLQEVYQLGIQSGQKQTGVGAALEVIETSQIDGEFNGWEGVTIVKLVNGEVWQQIEYYRHYRYAYMPKVIVYRDGEGFKMKVEGVDKAVGVDRLR